MNLLIYSRGYHIRTNIRARYWGNLIIWYLAGINLVPRACDPREATWGSGITRCWKPGILAKTELRITYQRPIRFLPETDYPRASNSFPRIAGSGNEIGLESLRLEYKISDRILFKVQAFFSDQQILRVSSRCSLTISIRVQQPHTAQKLTILIQNCYKVLQNLLCPAKI
jgi:hypothetical protein